MAPALAIIIVVLGMTWSMLGWPYPLWVQTSAQFHQQFTWAGLIAATSACWYATVLHAKDRIWAQPHAPRLGTPAAVRHLITLVCWFVGAYLVALLPLVVSTMDGIGTPDPLAMLSGVLAMIAATTLGYALGTLIPSAVMVPLVAVGCYALLVAGGTQGERLAAVAPVLYLDPELGQHESLPLLMFRVALFAVLTVAAAGLAARAMTRTQPWRLVVYLAVPAALVAAALVRRPAVFVADAHPPTTCTEQRGIRYCVHVENRPRLAELVRSTDPVIVRFGTKPANIDQIWDQSLTAQPIDAERARGVELAWLEPDGTIQSDIATTAAGVYACAFAEPSPIRSEEDTERLTQAAIDLSEYLTTGALTGTLSTLSARDVQRWLARHQDQLHACTLTPDQLPR